MMEVDSLRQFTIKNTFSNFKISAAAILNFISFIHYFPSIKKKWWSPPSWFSLKSVVSVIDVSSIGRATAVNDTLIIIHTPELQI